MAATTLYVCTTCRRAEPEEALLCATCPANRPGGERTADCTNCPLLAERPRSGVRMLAAIEALALPDGVEVRGVECLSACSNACSVALSAQGKWTYVYGNMDPDLHAAAILDGAARYAASDNGLVPWRERPEVFRKQSLARVPPFHFPPQE